MSVQKHTWYARPGQRAERKTDTRTHTPFVTDMAKKAYQPPTVKMIDGTLCHYCNERPFVAGLVLPNGVQVCRECYDKHVEKDPKEETKRRR